MVRHLVPRIVRHHVSGRIAQFRSAALRRRLATIAAESRPIFAGPWLGEVGFEVLYWMPFLRWVAEEFAIAPGRMIVMSRGGTQSWYQPFAGTYHDVFTYASPQAFRDDHQERLRAAGQQKQVRGTVFERSLQDTALSASGARDAAVLHPSVMFELFNPFWWRHLDERWVHRHARYARLSRPAPVPAGRLPDSYAAVKFYFNDSFPDTARTRAFTHSVVRQLSGRMPVVSLGTPLNLDDHGAYAPDEPGVMSPSLDADPRCNLHVQSAIVAGAATFVGTYGGFSYLAPFYGVPTVAYYDDPTRFSSRHLDMARSALASVGLEPLFGVRAVEADAAA